MKANLALIACLLAFAAPGQAATLFFQANLDADQSGTSAGSSGFGTVTLQLDDATGVWSLAGSFSSLTGNATVAHIHGPAAAGINAGVLKDLLFTGTTGGTLSGSNVTAAQGVYTAPQIADLQAGLHYVNLHSTSFGGGEIRGQLGLVPEPSTLGLVAFSGLALVRRRR